MKFTLLVFVFELLFVTSVAQQPIQKLTTQIDNLLQSEFKPGEPGAVVLVAQKGNVIYRKAFGMANLELNLPMNESNVFWIASIGKQFTSIAILQLVEKGLLNLQDAITRFIPDYPTGGINITIEHLLTHTSGIQNFSGMKDPEKKLALDCTPQEVIDFFKNLPMRFFPGTKWEYSNSGYFILGYIIEKITGESYADYLEKNFFKPLRMKNTHYASDKKIIKYRVGSYTYADTAYQNAISRNITHVYSAGAIQSTVDDILIWHQAVHSYKLINKEHLFKAFTRFKLTDGSEADYGYGWRLGNMYESPTIWHGGLIAGFGTIEMYLPEEDVFVVVFSNCDCYYPREIALKLAALTAGKVITSDENKVYHSTLLNFKGLYENKKGQQMIISTEKDRLFSQTGRGPKSELKPYQKDAFFFDNDTFKMIGFNRNYNDGRITSLTTKTLEGNDLWYKTNKPIPASNGIMVDEHILQSYVGEYEIPSVFRFSVQKIKNRLFVQAIGQEQIEIFAESNSKFFTKINDAEFEFVKDESGNVTKVMMSQGGRKAEAKRLR